MSDQMGANVSGLLYLRRREGSFGAATARYVRNPVMITSFNRACLAYQTLDRPVSRVQPRNAGHDRNRDHRR